MFSTYAQRRDWDELQKAIDEAPSIPACTNDPDSWFPDAGGEMRLVMQLCNACPVQQRCAEYGIKWELHGVWGGLYARQRMQLRRKRGLEPLTTQSIPEPLKRAVDPLLDTDLGEVA